MDLLVNNQTYRICVSDSIYINRIGEKDCKILKQQKAEYGGIKDQKGTYWETVAVFKYEDADVIEIYEDLPSKITVDFLIREGFLKRPYQSFQIGGI